MAALDELGLDSSIRPVPVEVDLAIPFEEDEEHHVYEPEHAHLFWRQLVQADRVLREFRGRFAGKVAPCTSSGAGWTWR